MKRIIIPESCSNSEIVYPIIAYNSDTKTSEVLGKITIDKYNATYTPMIKNILIRECYKKENGITLLIMLALWERFGNYIMSTDIEIPLGVYKLLSKYNLLDYNEDGVLFGTSSYSKLKEIVIKLMKKQR